LFRDWFCHGLREQLAGAHVRFGSKADMCSAKGMSALPPKADIGSAQVHVRFGPILLKKSVVATHDIH
jgi:hypothetical protein